MKVIFLTIFFFLLSLFVSISYISAADNYFGAEYFNNTSLSGSPVLQRNDSVIDFSWGSGSPDPLINNDNFSVRWVRTVTFEDATYDFTVTADDGVRLYIDNELIINKWIDQPPTTYTASKSLTAGDHTIRMEYYEKGGGATAKLSWAKQPPPPLPSASFTGEYFNNISLSGSPNLTRFDSSINFSWSSGSPDPVINNDNFSARWVRTLNFEEGNYEITATADDGVRIYLDNELVLDKWKDQPPTTYNFIKFINAGDHTIRMEYYEKGGGATAKLSWIKQAPPPPPPPPAESFAAQYFNNTSLSGSPVLQRNDSVIDFSWGSGSPDPLINNDNFSVRWVRTVTFEDATYDFTVTADDGVRLYIDNELIINKWIDQPPTTYTASKSLTAGDHTIRMEYYEKGGGATAKLSWIKEIPPVLPPYSPTSPSTSPNLKVAFIGDQGLLADSIAVLELIKDENTDLVIHSGDFDYVDNPDAWDQQINDILGSNFPYFASVGNHDLVKWPEYQQKLIDRLNRVTDAECTGDLGVKSACRYKGLFFVLSGPGLLGANHDQYIKDQLLQDNSIWSICSWHVNQRLMQVGGKTDQAGWPVYEECRNGGGIIATAHEHSYSRTHLMSNFENQVVSSTSNVFAIEKGKTFAFVSGLGGESIRAQLIGGYWWASVYTSSQGASAGTLFCSFNVDNIAEKAHCYFKDILGNIPDSFDVYSKVENPNLVVPNQNNGIVSSSILTSSDDAEENPNGNMYLNSSDLELVNDTDNGGNQTVGLRFTNLSIPQNATITNAYIQFAVDETNSRETNLVIKGEKTANSTTFTSVANNISSRPTTTAFAEWVNVPSWTTIGASGIDQSTVDISAIVQELVSDIGWSSGNSISFIITGSGRRVAQAFERAPSTPSRLVIEWSVGS